MRKRWEKLTYRLDLAINFIQSDQLEKAKVELRKLIREEPLFVDAYNHLGNIEFKNKNYNKALKLYKSAFKIGDIYKTVKNDSNSDSISNLITWGNVDCRPFFRATHGLGLCYVETGNIVKAIKFFELILKYDPNDHLFVSFLLGDLHFKVGNYEESREYFTNSIQYTPYKYSLALLSLKEKEHIEALTLLRKGFTENIYIAKLLLGINPMTSRGEYNQTVHIGGNCEIETASDYSKRNLETWRSIDGAIPFLKSVYSNLTVRSETETFFKTLIKLYNAEPNSLERKNFIKQVDQIEREIDDDSSKGILNMIDFEFRY